METYIVNAFTEEIGQGNQAGVVFYDDSITDEMMQKIAFDIGKSESAFIRKEGDEYVIRWFSPLQEMPLCGHATLAASKVITQKEQVKNISFRYKAGDIHVAIDGEERISMSFPRDKYQTVDFNPVYTEFFGVKEGDCISCIQGRVTKKVVLILSDGVDLKSIVPNFSLMKNYVGACNHGIGISQRSKVFDFETRYFNPWAGVNEDFVTGSVHTVLAGYWGSYLGKRQLVARQNSPRPGVLKLDLSDDKVLITGKARIVFQGEVVL